MREDRLFARRGQLTAFALLPANRTRKPRPWPAPRPKRACLPPGDREAGRRWRREPGWAPGACP